MKNSFPYFCKNDNTLRTVEYFFYCWLLIIAPQICAAQVDSSGIKDVSVKIRVKDSLIRSTTVADLLPVEDSLIQYKLNGQFLKSVFSDAAYVVTRPVYWQGRDFKKLGIVVGATGILMLTDQKIKSVFQHNQNNFTNSVANLIEPFGNRYSPYIMAGMYVVGTAIKSPELKNAALLTFKSYCISTALYLTSKSILRRNRPAYTNNFIDFKPPFSNDRKHTSFPSGHTLTVMTLATAVSEAFGKNHPWVPWVAYSVAGLTGISRIYHNRHWTSDVWSGAALGYFVTKAVFKNNRVKKRRNAFELVWR